MGTIYTWHPWLAIRPIIRIAPSKPENTQQF